MSIELHLNLTAKRLFFIEILWCPGAASQQIGRTKAYELVGQFFVLHLIEVFLVPVPPPEIPIA